MTDLGIVRRMLQEMTDQRRACPRYPEALTDLNNRFGSHLEIASDPETGADACNCHAYALGLFNIPYYTKKALEHDGKRALVDSGFMMKMILTGKLRRRRSRPKINALVCYFHKGWITHSGRIVSTDGLTRSKWGTQEVHLHGQFEVPEKYGDEIRLYDAPTPAHAWEWLVDELNAS